MAPASEPIREKILAAIADRLATIQAGPLYWTTPKVTRALLSIDQYKTPTQDFPLLGVVRSSGSTFEPVTLDRRAHTVRVAVWGYVQGDPAAPAGTWLERLWADMTTCLLGDPSLGGLVLDLECEGPTDTDEGLLEPLALFAQGWRAEIHEAAA